jgi:FAD:protein FMN transferase
MYERHLNSASAPEVAASSPSSPGIDGRGSDRPATVAATTWEQWSCVVRITVADRRVLTAARQIVVALMADVAAAVSRFDPLSDLSRINARAGTITPVSPLCAQLVGIALDAARTTEGACDPTVGAHLVAAGYDRDFELIRTDVIEGAPWPERSADWQAVVLDSELKLVGIPKGLALDLGAVAKAWTADEAARRIHASSGTAALVEIGGDLAAVGSPGAPWLIRVAERAGEPGQLVSLSHGGLATSTTTRRRWRRGLETCHHLIDPRTGRSAVGPWRTASVWASTAAEANAASTAALVVGGGAARLLTELGYPARLVGIHGTVVLLGDWPADQAIAS